MCKYKVIGVILTLSLSFLTLAHPSDLEKEVLASFQSLVDASKKLDSKTYLQHFDADVFVGLSSDGTNWNSINDLIPVINNGFSSLQEVVSLELTNVKVSIIDDYTAILVNEFSQSMLMKNGTKHTLLGGGTQVWSKRSGQFKLVSVSASNKPNI